MNKILIIALLLKFSLFQVSCGGSLTIEGSNTESKNSFPNEFYYKSKGSCATGNLFFEHLQAVVFLIDAESSTFLSVQQKLFLHKDGTFDLQYREFDSNQQVHETKLKSTYQKNLENNSINLQNLGIGTFYQDNGQYFLEIQYQVSLNSPLLKDKIAKFKIVNTDQGLDTDRIEFCQNQSP